MKLAMLSQVYAMPSYGLNKKHQAHDQNNKQKGQEGYNNYLTNIHYGADYYLKNIVFTGQNSPNRGFSHNREEFHNYTRGIAGEILRNSTTINLRGENFEFVDRPMVPMVLQPTLNCCHNCGFCIESGTDKRNTSELDDKKYAQYAADVIRDFENAGKTNTVTITGGEPLLRYDRVKMLLDELRDNKNVTQYGINTSGTPIRYNSKYIDLLNEQFKTGKFFLNISRHHWDDDKNAEIFRGKDKPLSLKELTELNEQLGGNVSLQLVLNKDGVYSYEGVKEYIKRFSDLGIKFINIRSMVPLDESKGASESKVEYSSKSQDLNVENIIENGFDKDEDFEYDGNFTGEFFTDEYYIYKNNNGTRTKIRFIHSDHDALDEAQKDYAKQYNKMAPADIAIIGPGGNIFGSWNYDNGELIIN